MKWNERITITWKIKIFSSARKETYFFVHDANSMRYQSNAKMNSFGHRFHVIVQLTIVPTAIFPLCMYMWMTFWVAVRSNTTKRKYWIEIELFFLFFDRFNLTPVVRSKVTLLYFAADINIKSYKNNWNFSSNSVLRNVFSVIIKFWCNLSWSMRKQIVK